MTKEQAVDALKVCQAHGKLNNDYCLLNNCPLMRLTNIHLSNLEDYIVDFIKCYSNLL